MGSGATSGCTAINNDFSACEVPTFEPTDPPPCGASFIQCVTECGNTEVCIGGCAMNEPACLTCINLGLFDCYQQYGCARENTANWCCSRGLCDIADSVCAACAPEAEALRECVPTTDCNELVREACVDFLGSD